MIDGVKAAGGANRSDRANKNVDPVVILLYRLLIE